MGDYTKIYPPEYLEEYRGYILEDIAIAFLVLDIVFVALRFYSRYLLGKRLQADDYLMIPALVFCISTIAIALVAVKDGGVGRHVEYVAQHHDMFRVWYQTCMIAVAVTYMFAAALPKLSILALYLRIFVDKPSIWCTYATMSAIAVNVVVMIPVLVAKCNVISYGWESLLDPEMQDGWCANIEPRLQYASLANIITDVAMLLLPLPTMYKLRISRADKVGLALTFGMAAGGLITSCFRFAAFFKIAAYQDATWASVELVGWSIIEPGIYLFVASQMAFRPVIKAGLSTRIGLGITSEVRSITTHHPSTHDKVTKNAEIEQALAYKPVGAFGRSSHQSSLSDHANHHVSCPPRIHQSFLRRTQN